MEFKTGGTIRDVDRGKRIVVGYFTNTGSLDSDNDIFAKGAFEKTIKEGGPGGKNRIWHLWQHDSYSPIAKPKVLKEDDNGVYFETLIPKTAVGDLVMELYSEGHITEHSVGFNTLKYEDEKDARIIKEVRMWEGSSVLWGANENTPTVAVKKQDVLDRIGRLDAMLKKGELQDHVYELLITEIEKLKTAINSLGPLDAPEPREPQEAQFDISKLLNLI